MIWWNKTERTKFQLSNVMLEMFIYQITTSNWLYSACIWFSERQKPIDSIYFLYKVISQRNGTRFWIFVLKWIIRSNWFLLRNQKVCVHKYENKTYQQFYIVDNMQSIHAHVWFIIVLESCISKKIIRLNKCEFVETFCWYMHDPKCTLNFKSECYQNVGNSDDPETFSGTPGHCF